MRTTLLRFAFLSWALISAGLLHAQDIRLAASMAGARSEHTATLLTSGEVLVAGGRNGSNFLSTAERYDPATNRWRAAHAMPGAFGPGHTGTLLPSGKVLVTGGLGYGKQPAPGFPSPVVTRASAIVYDPASDNWIGTASMSTPRSGHTATLLPSGKVLVVGGYDDATSTTFASAEVFDPATNSWTPTIGSLTEARTDHTATLLASGKVLVVGGSYGTFDGNAYLASAELYDPTTNSWSPAGTLATRRANHTATAVATGKVLVMGGSNSSGYPATAELYDTATNVWSLAAAPAFCRVDHTAALLPSGMVLIAGGSCIDTIDIFPPLELYNPINNTWSQASSTLSNSRRWHTATLLPTGSVLIAGGYEAGPASYLASAERYDPISDQTAPAPALIAQRWLPTATLLLSGKVLVTGGEGAGGPLASAEIYDPASNTWNSAGTLTAAREGHTATLLPSGKVLVTGGSGGGFVGPLASADIYDPASNTWSAAGALTAAREFHTATLLPSGKVLVTGGGGNAGTLASTEIYDPASNTWSAAGALAKGRYRHTATLLLSGKVLVTGGESGLTIVNSELYDPATNTWAAAGALTTGRSHHTATLLPSGQVLVVGGQNDDLAPIADVELYDPTGNTWMAAAALAYGRYDHAATLLPSGQVLVTSWIPGEGPEIYDPASNAWITASAQLGFSATLLLSGRVLIVGNPDVSLYDPGLTPKLYLRPSLIDIAGAATVSSFGSFYPPLYGYPANATGFQPMLQASGGGTNDSASNYPVLQIERIDNQQQRFIPNDESVGTTDTLLTGAANALDGFPAGPVLTRVWVNGVPSAALPALVSGCKLLKADTIFADGFGACP